MTTDILKHNQHAWDELARSRNQWTRPVATETIDAARRGDWSVLLTDSRPTPRSWFPTVMKGCRILCLASGGGQQGPILAAAGADVIVYDQSTEQLARDRLVAEREGLPLTTIQGDMANLSAFADASFDLIFHPVSNIFVPDVQPVWNECYRVLEPGGALLSGTVNPVEYAFDRHLADTEGIFQLKYSLPYSDLESLSEDVRREQFGEDAPLEFSHTLEELIGGQIAAGFLIAGFYESYRSDDPIARYMPSYIATRAIKPGA